MSENWIEQYLAERKSVNSGKRDDALKLRIAVASGPRLFGSLSSTVKKAMDIFCQKTGCTELVYESVQPSCFIVRKLMYPAVKMTVEFRTPVVIEYQYHHTPDDSSTTKPSDTLAFRLIADVVGNVQFTQAGVPLESTESAAKILLKPILDLVV